ncbi:acylphosphatase [Zoogloea sp.]|uniref:acylphosphatase n=1 Tax=Zoogloea sp. TaxID=49181 RepID=UPI0035B091C0
MKTASDTARLLRIHGSVQGVGYRNAFHAQALHLGLAGWVRNRSDGTVEALVAGPAAAIDTIIEWARRGPPAARVSRVEWETVDPPESLVFSRADTV